MAKVAVVLLCMIVFRNLQLRCPYMSVIVTFVFNYEF